MATLTKQPMINLYWQSYQDPALKAAWKAQGRIYTIYINFIFLINFFKSDNRAWPACPGSSVGRALVRYTENSGSSSGKVNYSPYSLFIKF